MDKVIQDMLITESRRNADFYNLVVDSRATKSRIRKYHCDTDRDSVNINMFNMHGNMQLYNLGHR